MFELFLVAFISSKELCVIQSDMTPYCYEAGFGEKANPTTLGSFLVKQVVIGPKNKRLGSAFIQLMGGTGIHGNYSEESRYTKGCIKVRDFAAEWLASHVKVGTKVIIVR